MTTISVGFKKCFSSWGLGKRLHGVTLGLKEKVGKRKVCKLKKSLYGLKQSPRA